MGDQCIPTQNYQTFLVGCRCSINLFSISSISCFLFPQKLKFSSHKTPRFLFYPQSHDFPFESCILFMLMENAKLRVSYRIIFWQDLTSFPLASYAALLFPSFPSFYSQVNFSRCSKHSCSTKRQKWGIKLFQARISWKLASCLSFTGIAPSYIMFLDIILWILAFMYGKLKTYSSYFVPQYASIFCGEIVWVPLNPLLFNTRKLGLANCLVTTFNLWISAIFNASEDKIILHSPPRYCAYFAGRKKLRKVCWNHSTLYLEESW